MPLDPNAPANLALKQVFSGVDKLKTLGFKKKAIFKKISIHFGRRKRKHISEMLRAGLQALVGRKVQAATPSPHCASGM
jgi:hypothetical protein